MLSAADRTGNDVYMFSGRNEKLELVSFLRKFNLDSKTWATIQTTGDTPLPRVGAALVSVGDSLLLFGGKSSEQIYFNDMWSYSVNLTLWTKLALPKDNIIPAPRSDFAALAFPNRTAILVYGGRNIAGPLSEMWIYNIEFNSMLRYK